MHDIPLVLLKPKPMEFWVSVFVEVSELRRLLVESGQDVIQFSSSSRSGAFLLNTAFIIFYIKHRAEYKV